MAKLSNGTSYNLKLRLCIMGSVIELENYFAILCGKDLAWVPFGDPTTSSVKRFKIGKVLEDGQVYIGDVYKHLNVLQIGYDIGLARIRRDYYELIEKESITEEDERNIGRKEQIFNLSTVIRERKTTFLGQERLCDLKFLFDDSTNVLTGNKVILAQVSPIFYEMDVGTDEVTINDFDFSTFEVFIG